MNQLNPNLNNAVLERVRVVYTLRRFSSPVVVKSVGLIALLSATILQVSVLSVIANSPSPAHPGALYTFAYSAFSNTGWLVRLTIFGLMFILGWLLGDAWRNFNFSRLTRFVPNPRRFHFSFLRF
ncbi:MAG: hypothetical protein Q7T49_01020 [bacterium]|nr:hypothetical protein [bacterium]